MNLQVDDIKFVCLPTELGSEIPAVWELESPMNFTSKKMRFFKRCSVSPSVLRQTSNLDFFKIWGKGTPPKKFAFFEMEIWRHSQKYVLRNSPRCRMYIASFSVVFAQPFHCQPSHHLQAKTRNTSHIASVLPIQMLDSTPGSLT